MNNDYISRAEAWQAIFDSAGKVLGHDAYARHDRTCPGGERMSLYIPGLNLPPKGEAYMIDPDGVVYRRIPTNDGDDAVIRKIDVTIIEVPPHGRLVDADAMAVEESEAYMSAQIQLTHDPITSGINTAVHAKIVRLIADTETIIPADKEEP